MANFTINSLANSGVNGGDNFIKSDGNGVLTKTSFKNIKDAVVGTADFSNLGSTPADALANLQSKVIQNGGHFDSTYGTGQVTVVKYGELAIINGSIQITKNIPAYTDFVTVLPTPRYFMPIFFGNYSTNEAHALYFKTDSGSGATTIRNRDVLTTGSEFNFYVSYLALPNSTK